jgi:hypothetical protein
MVSVRLLKMGSTITLPIGKGYAETRKMFVKVYGSVKVARRCRAPAC